MAQSPRHWRGDEGERDFEAINPIVVEQKYSGKSHRQHRAEVQREEVQHWDGQKRLCIEGQTRNWLSWEEVSLPAIRPET